MNTSPAIANWCDDCDDPLLVEVAKAHPMAGGGRDQADAGGRREQQRDVVDGLLEVGHLDPALLERDHEQECEQELDPRQATRSPWSSSSRLRSSRSSSVSSRRLACSEVISRPCSVIGAVRTRGNSIEPVAAIETRLAIGGERVAGEGAEIAVENPFSEETVATVGAPSDEQLDAAIAAAAEAQRGWERTPAVERGEMLHEVATRLRARTDELAELMTLEGGKPLIENSDEIGWTAAAFDYYAEIGRDSAGRVIPSIEASQLALVVKDPVGPVACIVPWNYPLLLLAWKLAPALAAGNATVSQAVGGDAALHPRRRLLLRPPAGRGRQRGRRGRRRRRRDRRRRADRVRRLHRLGRDRQADRRRLRRARRPGQPRDGRQGPVHRLRRRRRQDRDRGPRRRLGGVPQRRPGLHLGRALLRPRRASTTTTCRRSPTTPARS